MDGERDGREGYFDGYSEVGLSPTVGGTEVVLLRWCWIASTSCALDDLMARHFHG